MILTKNDILERIASKELEFNPTLDRFQLQSHSVDLRLGSTFMIPKMWRLTDKGRESVTLKPLQKPTEDFYDIVELTPGQHFDLLPQEHILVSTHESVKIAQDLMAVLYPRSSTNRKGLSLDLTGIIDAGYEGPLILPITNNTRSQVITLYPGERFCQLTFNQLSNTIEDPRKSRYHQREVVKGVAAEEKKEETELIIRGDITKIKDEFRVN